MSLVEEINKLVSESISKYLQGRGVNILGEPLSAQRSNLKKLTFGYTDSEFEFDFDLGLAPSWRFLDVTQKDKVPV